MFKIYEQMASILVKELRLKSRKHLMRSDLNVVVIDVTEQSIQSIEHPPKGQAACYSGKKQRTIKAQLIVDFDTLEILSVVCRKVKTTRLEDSERKLGGDLPFNREIVRQWLSKDKEVVSQQRHTAKATERKIAERYCQAT